MCSRAVVQKRPVATYGARKLELGPGPRCSPVSFLPGESLSGQYVLFADRGG
jgi:hypothetical protein